MGRSQVREDGKPSIDNTRPTSSACLGTPDLRKVRSGCQRTVFLPAPRHSRDAAEAVPSGPRDGDPALGRCEAEGHRPKGGVDHQRESGDSAVLRETSLVRLPTGRKWSVVSEHTEEDVGALIDRVRGPLDLRTVKTVFGRRQRPRRHKGQPRTPVVEVSLATLEYDLAILRIRFRRLTLKISWSARVKTPEEGGPR